MATATHLITDKEVRFTVANYKDFEQLCSQWPK